MYYILCRSVIKKGTKSKADCTGTIFSSNEIIFGIKCYLVKKDHHLKQPLCQKNRSSFVLYLHSLHNRSVLGSHLKTSLF